MAGARDWISLAQMTVRALERRHVTELVSLEWPEAQRRLLAGRAEEIDAEPRRLKRWFRFASAILYGLVERLAPQRRVIFVMSLFALAMSIFALAAQESWQEPTFLIYAGFAAAFLGVSALLAMELIDKLKFRDELEIARELQAQLVPHQLPEIPGWELAAFNEVANTVGGDIYDFVELPDRRIAVLFGDASGHGMAAGLIMAVARAAFRTQLRVDPHPEAVFEALNSVLCHTGNTRSFFAAAYALLSPDGRWSAVVAGHPPILQLDAEGHIARTVGEGAYPLGIRQPASWRVERGSLASGETLVFHSDGLMEARNEYGVAFGDERIASICRWSREGSVRALVGALTGHWREYIRRAGVEDDVSIGAIRRMA